MITEFDGRQIIGAAMKLTNAGDGLSQHIKLKGEIPDFHLGQRATVVHDVELTKVGLEPAVKDDLEGDLILVFTWRALDGLTTDAPAVRTLLDKHKAALAKARELEGQGTLLDGDEDDEALADKEERLAAEENAAKASEVKQSTKRGSRAKPAAAAPPADDWGDDD